jgi:hypothetical protein
MDMIQNTFGKLLAQYYFAPSRDIVPGTESLPNARRIMLRLLKVYFFFSTTFSTNNSQKPVIAIT